MEFGLADGEEDGKHTGTALMGISQKLRCRTIFFDGTPQCPMFSWRKTILSFTYRNVTLALAVSWHASSTLDLIRVESHPMTLLAVVAS